MCTSRTSVCRRLRQNQWVKSLKLRLSCLKFNDCRIALIQKVAYRSPWPDINNNWLQFAHICLTKEPWRALARAKRVPRGESEARQGARSLSHFFFSIQVRERFKFNSTSFLCARQDRYCTAYNIATHILYS